MEIYNLGIGLSVVDSASKPVQAVDSALATLSKTAGSMGGAATLMGGNLDRLTANMLQARDAAREFDTILTGNTLDDSLRETAGSGRDMADVADMLVEQLGAAGNRAAYARDTYDQLHTTLEEGSTASTEAVERADAAAHHLATSLGLVRDGTYEAAGGIVRMRDPLGRFTKVNVGDDLDGMAGSAAHFAQTLGDVYGEAKRGSGFANLGAMFQKVGASITGMVNSFEDLSFLGSYAEPFEEFEDSTHKMAVGMGGAGREAYAMRDAIIDTVAATQFSIQEIGQLAQGLSTAGVNFAELSDEAKNAYTALSNIYNVGGEAIAQMDSTMRAFGGTLEGTLDDAAAFQDKFQVSGMFEALPGVISHAEQSVTRFGSAVTGSGQDVMRSVMATGGAFSKAFGKTISEAISDAQAHFDRFAQASHTHRKVFLGLADDFDPIQKALMETGMPLMQTSALMQQARDDAVGFAQTMQARLSRLNPFRRGRLLEQLRDELPAATMQMIEIEGRLEQVVNARAAAEQRAADIGARNFKELTGEVLNTTKEMRAMWQNVKDLSVAFLTQTGIGDVLKSMFAGAKDTLAGWSAQISTFVKSKHMETWRDNIQKSVPFLKTLGKWLLIGGSALGGFFSILGAGLVKVASFKAAGKVTGVLQKLLTTIGKSGGLTGLLAKGAEKIIGLLPRLSKVFLKAIPGVGQIYAIFTGVSEAFTDMGETLGDPSASGAEKLQALFRGVAKGVVKTFDSLLLGIPGWILGKFFPGLERSFDKGFAGLFGGGGDSWFDLGAMTTWLGEKFGSAVSGIGDWVQKSLPSWEVMIGEWGSLMGKALGGLTKLAIDALVNYGPTVLWYLTWPFNPYLWWQAAKAAWNAVVGYLSGEGGMSLSEGLADVFYGAYVVIKKGLYEFAEGFVGAFGTSLDELWWSWAKIWSHIKEFTTVAFLTMGNGVWTWLFDPIKTAASHIRFAFEGLWTLVKFAGKSAFAALEDAFSGDFSTMKIFGLNILKSIVEGLMEVPKAFISVVKDLANIANKVPGVNIDVSGLDEMTAGLDENTQKFTDMVDAEEKAIKKRGSKLATLKTERQTALVALKTEHDERLKGIKDSAAARKDLIKGIKDEAKLDREGYEKNRKKAVEVRVARAQNETNARLFRKRGLTQLDRALRSVEARGSQLEFDPAGMQAAEKHVRDYMDASLKTLTKKVATGKMDAKAAGLRLAQAEKKAVDDALAIVQKSRKKAKRDAADVANKAKGKHTDMKEIASMMKEFAKSASAQKMRERIEIRFPQGTGDAIDKFFQNKTKVRSRMVAGG